MNKQDFIQLGGHERVYINAETFNGVAGTSFGDNNNQFYFDCNTKALMRSYKGKKPTVEIQF